MEKQMVLEVCGKLEARVSQPHHAHSEEVLLILIASVLSQLCIILTWVRRDKTIRRPAI